MPIFLTSASVSATAPFILASRIDFFKVVGVIIGAGFTGMVIALTPGAASGVFIATVILGVFSFTTPLWVLPVPWPWWLPVFLYRLRLLRLVTPVLTAPAMAEAAPPPKVPSTVGRVPTISVYSIPKTMFWLGIVLLSTTMNTAAMGPASISPASRLTARLAVDLRPWCR
ncbi:MAG: hypothetical protein GU348_04980 [Thermogladius sp.]|nr:hypothetical protein [Thermogladius sp.]